MRPVGRAREMNASSASTKKISSCSRLRRSLSRDFKRKVSKKTKFNVNALRRISESARKVPNFLFAVFFFLFARPTDLAEKIKITRGPCLSYKLHCGMHTGLVILRLEIY